MITWNRLPCLLLVLLISIPSLHAEPSADAQLVPKSTSIILQLDYQSLQKSDVYKTFFAINPAFQQQLNVARNQFNFDVSKDLGVLTIGIDGNAYAKGKQDEAIVVILNPALPNTVSFFEKMAGGQLATVQHGKQTYQRLGPKGSNATSMAVYRGRTVIAKESVLKSILDGSHGLPDSLSALSAARTKTAQIWAGALPLPEMTASLPFPVETAEIALTFAKDIQTSLAVETTVENASGFVEEFVRQKKTFEGHPMIKKMGLGQAFEKLTMEAKDKRIHATLSLTMKEVGAILNGLRTAPPQNSRQPNEKKAFPPPSTPRIPPPQK